MIQPQLKSKSVSSKGCDIFVHLQDLSPMCSSTFSFIEDGYAQGCVDADAVGIQDGVVE